SVMVAALTCQPKSAHGDQGSSTDHGPDDRGPVAEVRPHAGIGWASGYGGAGDGLAFHAGGRLLFPAPLSPTLGARFGIEATYLDLDVRKGRGIRERYTALGIILEMRLFRNFLLGIGTLGYVGVGSTDRNPFGVVTNLGWEPSWHSRALPFVTFRSEWIFDGVVFNVLSLSAGITFGI
ncbi:MAG: hypothetical protein AAF436_10670, partial [Myxococcota bacterium]